jgi:large subunit ribosomal protein L18
MMNAQAQKLFNRARRTIRVRSRVRGTHERPRLAVHISNHQVTAQIIDDSDSKTVAYVTTVGQKIEGSLSKKAEWVGHEIAKKAKRAKVERVVFDRRGRKYHGRLKVLADAVRADGVEF